MRALISVTFVFDPKEDRILAVINAGRPDAWSCWLTRRLTLALLERTTEYLTSTSDLAQRVPAEHRSESLSFEREAAIAKTAGAMSTTPPDILKSTAAGAELAERLQIAPQGDRLRLELSGQTGDGAAGLLTRAELQRILQMLKEVAGKAGWFAPPPKPQAAPAPDPTQPKPFRH